MNNKHHFHERAALIGSITITILSWSYVIAAVGGKLIAPAVI